MYILFVNIKGILMIRDYKSPKWDRWYDGLVDDPSGLPFRFTYDNKSFTSFCYFDPEKEEGVILAFRQERCPLDTLDISLPFAKDFGSFVVLDEDTKEEYATDGKLSITFDAPRSAKLLWIKKLNSFYGIDSIEYKKSGSKAREISGEFIVS